jgi:hypothetical protein
MQDRLAEFAAAKGQTSHANQDASMSGQWTKPLAVVRTEQRLEYINTYSKHTIAGGSVLI